MITQQHHSVAKVAERLGINPRTVQRLIGTGALVAIDVSPGAGPPLWRISDSAIQAFRNARSNRTTDEPAPSRRGRTPGEVKDETAGDDLPGVV